MSRMRQEIGAGMQLYDEEKTPCREPTKWFGSSNVRALGHTQKRFRECTSQAVRLANLTAELMAITAEYGMLLAEKESMMKQKEAKTGAQ